MWSLAWKLKMLLYIVVYSHILQQMKLFMAEYLVVHQPSNLFDNLLWWGWVVIGIWLKTKIYGFGFHPLHTSNFCTTDITKIDTVTSGRVIIICSNHRYDNMAMAALLKGVDPALTSHVSLLRQIVTNLIMSLTVSSPSWLLCYDDNR